MFWSFIFKTDDVKKFADKLIRKIIEKLNDLNLETKTPKFFIEFINFVYKESEILLAVSHIFVLRLNV